MDGINSNNNEIFKINVELVHQLSNKDVITRKVEVAKLSTENDLIIGRPTIVNNRAHT